VPVEDFEHAWAMLGLTVADSETPALSQADVDALATWVALKTHVGEDGAAGLLRVVGAFMARLAEAETTAVIVRQPDLWMVVTNDELTTAQAYRAIAELIPRMGAMIDAVHRHHLSNARANFGGGPGPPPTVACGVGFVDLSGFTPLTQMLMPAELSALLNGFSATPTWCMPTAGGW
jgi:class 3 adenylate cyclase